MDLQISKILGFAWKTFKSNWKVWVLGTLLLALLSVVGSVFGYQPAIKIDVTAEDYQAYQSGELSQKDMTRLSARYDYEESTEGVQEYVIKEVSGSWVVDVVVTILSFVAGIALLMMSIAHVRGESSGMISALKKVSLMDYLKYIAVVIVSTLLVILGFVALIIPGIIVALMFAFVTYLVLDQKTGVFATLSRSRSLVKGYKWDIVALGMVVMVVNLLGVLALLVGLLVTIPVTYLAWARMYDLLLNQEEQVSEEDMVIELDSVEEGDTTEGKSEDK